MTKPVFVQLLLDETGSRAGSEDQIVSGVNEYINTLRKKKVKNCTIRLTTFDSTKYDERYEKKLKDVEMLERGDFIPGAMTPLWDAIGRTIQVLEEKTNGQAVLVVIDTDGYENHSREFSKETISKLIKGKEDNAGWTFIFLGADLSDQASVMQSSAIGASAANTVGYAKGQTTDAYTRLAVATSSYAVTGGAHTKSFFADHGTVKDGQNTQQTADDDQTSKSDKTNKPDDFWSNWDNAS